MHASRAPATHINVIIKPIRRLGTAHRRLVYNLLIKRLLVIVQSHRQLLQRSFAPSLDRTQNIKHQDQATRLIDQEAKSPARRDAGPGLANVLSERILSFQTQPAQRKGFYGFYAKPVSPVAADIKT